MTEKPEPLLDVTVVGGKYRVVQEANGILYALRHGEPWRGLSGDNLVLALAQEVRALREKLAAAERAYNLLMDEGENECPTKS